MYLTTTITIPFFSALAVGPRLAFWSWAHSFLPSSSLAFLPVREPLEILFWRTTEALPISTTPVVLHSYSGSIHLAILLFASLARAPSSPRTNAIFLASWRGNRKTPTPLIPQFATDKMSDYKNGTAGRSKAKKGHCKRFWWVYLLVLIIIIVIVVPCM